MNYEAYQGKVLKVANVLKKIFKHIALIIGVISAVVLLVIAFLSTKGMILEVGEVKNQILYGENMTFDVNALFSRVEYEYSALDSDEWNSVEPNLVGKYKVRAKSFSSFGRNKYTEEYIYEIAPRQIDVNIISESIIYGEFPKFSATLAENDKLECKGFVFEDITQKKTNVKADIEQIAIYDENNQDVTFCYTINTENKGVNITPRPLSITVSSKSMVYNGTTLAFDGYEISNGTLAYSDKLGAEFNSSITDIGSVINRPDLKVRNADGVDVTTHYTMNVSVGTLTVTQRPIVIVTPSDEKTYDGEALENTSVIIYYGEEQTTESVTEEETTLPGYIEDATDSWWDESTDEIIWETEYPTYVEPDTYPLITEGWWGTESSTESTTMDTSDHYWFEVYTSWDEMSSEYIEFQKKIEYPYHYDMGHDEYCDFCWNYIGDTRGHDYVDYDGDDDCDKCMDNINNFGGPAEITHTHFDLDRDDFCDYCWESMGFYEGVPELLDKELVEEEPYLEEPTYPMGQITIEEQTTEGKEENTTSNPGYIIDTTKPGIVDGHTITFDRVTSITDAGTVDNIIHIGIYDENGVNKIGNYSFFYDFGTLTVNKREVTVTTPDETWVYDGKVHSTEVTIGGDGIVDGQTEQSDKVSIQNVGEIENTYNISDIVDADGNSVIHNYNITTQFGRLEVTPREIWVKSQSESIVYDGQPHSNYDILHGTERDYVTALAEGHEIRVTVYPTITNYTNAPVENKLTYAIFSGDVDVTDNYEITETWGSIEITKRPITLSSASGSYVYDGYSHNDGIITVGGEYGLALNQSLQSIYHNPFVNATNGDVENEPTFVIENIDGVSVAENYEITFEWGYINVAKRPLEYKTQSYSGVYDGYEHTFDTPIIDESIFDGMAFVPQIMVTNAPTVKNYTPNPIENTIEFIICDNESADITDNFDISCTEIGALYIRRREISVSTPTSVWQYDGMGHSVKQVWFGGDGIADPDTYYVTSGTEVKNNTFGPVDNMVEYVIEDMQGVDVSDNYQVADILYGTLEITPVYINIQSYDSAWIYDGYWHSSDINIFDANSGEHIFGIYYNDPDGFYMGHSLYGDTVELSIHTAALGWTDGPVENNFEITIYDIDGVDAVNELHNYVINNIDYGSLTIEKRPIQYATGSMSWVYDGQYHHYDNVIVNENEYMGYYSLADGDSIVVTSYPSIIDVKQSGMSNILIFAIYNSEGDDVTDWYEIILEGYGELEITRRRINYTSSSNTWEYDGLYHSDNSFTISTNLSNTYDLVAGDILSFETYTEIINAGSTSNYLNNGSIYSTERGMDVTDNYDIRRYGIGTLTITPRKITIKPVDVNKVYDGKTVNVTDWEYVRGSKTLLEGHTISRLKFKNGTHTNAGGYHVTIEETGYVITDADGNKITGNYDVSRYSGEINIERLQILITTHSAVKEYDGTPLICHEYDVQYLNGNAVAGHNISIDFTGRITGVGIVDNSFENVMITTSFDPYTNLLDLNYTLKSELGKLEVKGIWVGQLYSNHNGYEYIKTQSYGDYLGNGFAPEPEYPYLTHDGLTPDYLVSIALENKEYSVGKNLQLLNIQNGKMYFPSVSTPGGYFNFPTDIYGNINLLQGYHGEYQEYAQKYQQWVFQNYTSVDYETWEFMVQIIYEEGFNTMGVGVYDDIAKYIQNSARYGYDFDPAFDSDSNIAVSFLKHSYGDEAVCRHYATAATMLYRTLGIPARYTEGYLVKTEEAAQWYDVYAPGHAWVEIYITTLGWIPVEVTAGSDGFEIDGNIITNAGLGGITDGSKKQQLNFKPQDMNFNYTGDYVYHDGTWQSETSAAIKELEKQGYTFDVVIGNEEARDVGTYISYIQSVRVYYNGEDVTYKFDIKCDEGVINISNAIITIKPVDASKVYDGTTLYAPQMIEGNEIFDWMMKGYRFEYTVLGELTDVGYTNTYIDMSGFRVYDPDGIDVTDSFTVYDEYGYLEITPFVIDIFLYRNQKVYDGNPLDYASLNRTYYSVINQLPEGFALERFDVYLTMTDVGYYTVEDLNNMAWDRGIFNYDVIDQYGEYVTDNFIVRFVRLTDKDGVEKDYIPMEIVARKLTITTASESRVDDGSPLENHNFHIEGAGFAGGQYIELIFEGVCENVGDMVENKIVGYTIYDQYGHTISYQYFGIGAENGMTVFDSNYELTFIFGTLELLPNDSDIE